MSNKNCFPVFFAIYLGLSPIYWLPYVAPIFFIVVKNFLFIYILLCGLYFSIRNNKQFEIKIPGGYPIFFILIFMFFLVLPNFLFGNNENNFNTLMNLIQIIFFLIASRFIVYYKKVSFVIRLSLLVLSVFVVLSVLLMLTLPLEVNPYNEDLTLLETGFGGVRTGWTPSIGLFIPFILMFSKSYILLLIYLFSQMLTGGRAGFYLSILAVPLLVFIERSWRIKTRFIFIIVIIFLGLYIYNPSYFESFRVFTSLSGGEDADDFSSGRISLINEAWSSIMNSPFLGNSMHASFAGDNVHNVFLKGWVYYGLSYFVCSILAIFYIFLIWIKRFKRLKIYNDKKFFIILLIILLSGFFVGMVEPSIIFGNFTNFSIWWFVFALVASDDFLISDNNIKNNSEIKIF